MASSSIFTAVLEDAQGNGELVQAGTRIYGEAQTELNLPAEFKELLESLGLVGARLQAGLAWEAFFDPSQAFFVDGLQGDYLPALFVGISSGAPSTLLYPSAEVSVPSGRVSLKHVGAYLWVFQVPLVLELQAVLAVEVETDTTLYFKVVGGLDSLGVLTLGGAQETPWLEPFGVQNLCVAGLEVEASFHSSGSLVALTLGGYLRVGASVVSLRFAFSLREFEYSAQAFVANVGLGFPVRLLGLVQACDYDSLADSLDSVLFFNFIDVYGANAYLDGKSPGLYLNASMDAWLGGSIEVLVGTAFYPLPYPLNTDLTVGLRVRDLSLLGLPALVVRLLGDVLALLDLTICAPYPFNDQCQTVSTSAVSGVFDLMESWLVDLIVFRELSVPEFSLYAAAVGEDTLTISYDVDIVGSTFAGAEQVNLRGLASDALQDLFISKVEDEISSIVDLIVAEWCAELASSLCVNIEGWRCCTPVPGCAVVCDLFDPFVSTFENLFGGIVSSVTDCFGLC